MFGVRDDRLMPSTFSGQEKKGRSCFERWEGDGGGRVGGWSGGMEEAREDPHHSWRMAAYVSALGVP